MCIKGGNERRTYLVPLDLTLGVVLKVTVALEATFNELAKFQSKRFMVEEMVDAHAGAAGFRRVRRAYAALGRPNAFSAQFDFLKSVDNLVEIEHDVSTVRHE